MMRLLTACYYSACCVPLLACSEDDSGEAAASGGSGGSAGGASGGSGGTTSSNTASSSGGSRQSAGNVGGTSGSGGENAASTSSGGSTASSRGAGASGGSGSGAVGGTGGSSGGNGSGGAATSGGASSGGNASGGNASGGNASGGNGGGGGTGGGEGLFSFFVTSYAAMAELSGSVDGFGGDLRHGEETGLAGADKICTEIAESSMPGSGSKQWRAFLSVYEGPGGGPVHAIERIGEGPWYDRLGRLVAEDIEGLLQVRPAGHAQIADDLPNEFGEPNHFAGGEELDNHDIMTGSNSSGRLEGLTCSDWTDNESGGGPMLGHSWPSSSGEGWILAHQAAGCVPSVVDGEGAWGGDGVGDTGGYGGIYCFALTP